jgi:hypothetical protein
MITKEQALTLSYGDNLYFTELFKMDNAYLDSKGIMRSIGHFECGGKVRQVRVSGKLKTWKTRPNDWKLPVKYGMYENAYIGTVEGCEDPTRFFMSEQEASQGLPPAIKGRIGTKKQIKELNKLLSMS